MIANRLSEDENCTVLLLEAGGNPPVESIIPGLHTTIRNSPCDWQFVANSSNACKILQNGQCLVPRGKMLGGTSSMNWMIYVRGNQGDFDDWVEMGNPGWDSTTVWEYYKKSENNTYQPFVDEDDGEWHSNEGPMIVSFGGFTSPSEQIYNLACAEKGIPFVADMNAGVHHGVTDTQATVSGCLRESTASAFLASAMDRPNLHIVTTAFVEQILIDRNNQAYGVRYKHNGTTIYTVYACKEVILSAGSIMSPVLLMQSGIGQAKQLQKFNIPCKSNLKVGENLIDHPATMLIVSFNPTQPDPPTQPIKNIVDWAIDGSGRYTGIIQQWAFLSTNTSRPLNRPDTQVAFLYFPTQSPDTLTFLNSLGVRDDIAQQINGISASRDIGFIIPVYLSEKSTGNVVLGGKSVYDKPLINFNFFDNPDDMDIMITAIQNQITFLDTQTFQSFGARLEYPSIPECDRILNRTSPEYWKCYVTQFSSSAYHPVGTCKMGPTSDPGAVVDARLRVYGVKKLRVADASM